uniref:Glutathione S-transferase T3-like n=1 Tax=Tanacetum cinerariifolium TaxID=118510 RepID=A0A6L2KE72_TANCI|nr:hypothetical protein [Tanacetum cinerariifolium]
MSTELNELLRDENQIKFRGPGTITPLGLALTLWPALSYRRSFLNDGIGGRVAKPTPGKEAESTGDVTLRWSLDEEALLVECYIVVSEDRNVRRSQTKDTFWLRKNFQKRTKDMLTGKWLTLNHHCQKFNAIYKRCHRLKKSGDNEVDLMGRARVMYQDESRNSSFNHEKAWAILRQHAKWDAPEVAPVDLTEDETGDFHATVNTDELFGADPRPRVEFQTTP